MISVIVPTCNRAGYLSKALTSFRAQELDPNEYEVLVVDNGSKDNTREVSLKASEKFPQNRLLYLWEPIPGLLSGRHRGAMEASGDVLVFADDDIEADSKWLKAINETFQDRAVHIVGGRNLPNYESDPPEWLALLWDKDERGKWCIYLSLLDFGEQPCEIHPNFVWGLNFAIRKRTLFELGGFHPDCIPEHLQRFQGDGETGLTSNAAERGYKAVYQPHALVYHAVPAERMTIEYMERRQFYQGICDSFTEIRNNKGISTERGQREKKHLIRGVLSRTLHYPQVWRERLFGGQRGDESEGIFREDESDIFGEIRRRMRLAYCEGYRFHQDEVRSDPLLLEWVLKHDFFDYRLPQ